MKTNTIHAKKVLVVLFAMLMPLLTSAESVTIDNVKYNVILKGKTASVVGLSSGYKSEINIPSSITYEGVECNVTSIVSSAFYDCSKVASITLPPSITSIGERTFEGCSNLVSIKMFDGITSIGRKAFYQCSKLQAVTIPNGVKAIEEYTFCGCSNLQNAIIPEGVTMIGEYAFSDCTNLTAITIPNSVVSIGKNAFYYCKKLTSVSLPPNINSIQESTFNNCSSLASIIIPEGVTSIGNRAFYMCSSLASVVLSKSVSNIGDLSFASCESLSDIYCYAKEKPRTQSTAFNYSYPEYTTLHISEKALENYKSSTPWNKFGTIKALPKYKISYIVDDAVYHTDSIEHRDDIVLLEEPVKEGHTFSGWSEVPDTMPANDITVSGTFTINKYLITFTVDGEIVASDSLVYGASIVVPEILERGGYTFVGWENVAETVPACDMTYAGNYVANFYELTYVVDGEIMQADTIAFGTPITLAEEPTKEGYTFSGWSEVPEIMPISNLVVSGTFTINKYLVTFKIGDEVIASDSLEYSASIVSPEAPVKEGHTFNGWGEVAENVPAHDLTYEGSYAVSSYLLTVTVDGETVLADSVVYGTTVPLPEAPTKEGHTFSGWSEAPETMPAEDLTISGTFTINKYLVTFKIGDEVIASDSLEYGASIVSPEAPVKEGHTFNGWGEVAENVPAHDLTYEGSYAVSSYLLTVTVDGETVLADSVVYGTTVPLPEAPTKEGHTFSGWSEAPETMPAEDLTISGTFTINKYLVTFKIGDEVIASDSLEYGASIVSPEAPVKEGHTFNGWREVAENLPAHDVTYEGSYSINSYTLTYMVDGEIVLTLPVVYGVAIPSLKVPSKEGYTFSGWSEVPETMPAEDVTISATFTQLPSIYLTINQADNGHVKQHLVTGSVCTYTIEAAEGWEIHSVTFNGEDVTSQLTAEGTFTTPVLQDDAVLNIAYEKIEDNTAVENTRANAIKVQGHNGILRINGTTEDDAISVYTTEGTLVANEISEAGDTEITLPTGQVYIVTVGDTVVKIGM